MVSLYRVSKVYNKSEFEQEILIYNHEPVIEFRNTVEWHEKHKMLRVLFPVEVHSNTAVYDIAFGTVERPAHLSSAFDRARFEVCGHKWADISEGNYGVALINECKYGYSILNGEMQLSLLWSPTFPDEKADEGTHKFTYWLYPHSGGWRYAGVVQKAYNANIPLSYVFGGNEDTEKSFFSLNCSNVIIDTVKKAEDSDDIILRLYETYNQRGFVEIRTGFDFMEVYECDLLENNIARLADVKEQTIRTYINPYEIKTLRIKL